MEMNGKILLLATVRDQRAKIRKLIAPVMRLLALLLPIMRRFHPQRVCAGCFLPHGP
jgi:hypothetical protein